MNELLNLNLPPDYRPSEGEIDNLIYLTLRYTIDWTMREADKQVVIKLAGALEPGATGITRLVREAVEYAWDHLAGEPEEPTADALYAHMKTAIEKWYEITTVEERSSIK